jgi:hypothetical protein
VTEPFSVITSKGTWTNQSGIPTVHGYPLPFDLSDLLGYGYDKFLPDFPWKRLGGIMIGAAGYIFDARSGGCEYAGEPGGCVTVVSPDGHVLYPGDSGAPTICPRCPPYQEPGSAPILLNVPTGYSSTGPVDSGVQDSSGSIVIDSQLVSSAPAHGITIETQAIPNPSNDGIEVEAPSTAISIESWLLPSNLSGTVVVSPKRSFLDKLADGVQIVGEISGQIYPAMEMAQGDATKSNHKDPCSIISPGNIVYATGCTDSSGKPVKAKR